MSSTVGELNKYALEDRLIRFAVEASALPEFKSGSFVAIQLAQFRQLSKLGKYEEAETIWKSLRLEGFDVGMQAVAMHHFALHCFFRNILTEEILSAAEAKNRPVSAIGIRNLCGLRGFWSLERGDLHRAKEALQLAVTLAHKAGKVDRRSEVRLALAKQRLGELPEIHQLIDQFSQSIEDNCHREFAELLLTTGDTERAKEHAFLAFTRAWADGEPYVHRYELTKSAELLNRLGAHTPQLTNYDFSADEIFLWETEIDKAIAKVRSEPSAREQASKERQVFDLDNVDSKGSFEIET